MDNMKIYNIHETECVRIRDVSDESMRKRLHTFMEGQTRPLVDGVEMEDQDFIYVWDYENFLNKEEKGTEKFWD